MKKNCLLLFLSFFSLFPISHAQNYISFPDSNARWVNVTTQQSFPRYTFSIFCMGVADTLINSKPYSNIYSCYADSTNLTNFVGGYFGGLRDSAGQVFFVPKDSTVEFLLYDFTVNAGDTIWDAFGGLGQPLVVSFVDSTSINGQNRKRIHLQNGPSWVEGIGSTNGLFRPDFIPLSISWSLYCMSRDSISFIPNGFSASYNTVPGNCSLTVGIDKITNKEPPITVSPNPASDLINIQSSEVVREVLIYSSSGQLVAQESSNAFSVKELKPGVYFLKVQTLNNVFTHSFVKQ